MPSFRDPTTWQLLLEGPRKVLWLWLRLDWQKQGEPDGRLWMALPAGIGAIVLGILTGDAILCSAIAILSAYLYGLWKGWNRKKACDEGMGKVLTEIYRME